MLNGLDGRFRRQHGWTRLWRATAFLWIRRVEVQVRTYAYRHLQATVPIGPARLHRALLSGPIKPQADSIPQTFQAITQAGFDISSSRMILTFWIRVAPREATVRVMCAEASYCSFDCITPMNVESEISIYPYLIVVLQVGIRGAPVLGLRHVSEP